MNGILNILKPPGMTSFDVVGFLRGVLKTKKIGHTGTLDPAAVGVLPVCFGNATKAIEYMTEKDKTYRAEMTLGITTDTQDSQGQVLDMKPVNVSEVDIIEACKAFVGKLHQIPPMYSAVRVGGKKLYELAREGITVERKPREIEIYSLKIISIIQNRVIMDIACSKGTYIRTLCSDIGEKLGCGANMSFLIRLKAGAFDIDEALTMEQVCRFSRDGSLPGYFITADRVFEHLKALELDEYQEKKFLNGLYIPIGVDIYKQHEQLRIYGSKRNFIALGEIIIHHGSLMLKSKKVF